MVLKGNTMLKHYGAGSYGKDTRHITDIPCSLILLWLQY